MENGLRAENDCETIFDVNRNSPQYAIACALQDLERNLSKFNQSASPDRRTRLIDDIERLRRFVLVRASLAKALAAPTRRNNRTMGRQLCDALHEMIGDVPSFVTLHGAPGAPVMERDHFRVIACLNFLGSLDPEFL